MTIKKICMANIWVTGANGQLGNEMRRLVEGDARCRYSFTDVAELDITDADAVRRYMAEHNINVVVNCAAYTNVDKAEEEEETADRINHLAVGNLAVACRERDAVLIHVSTDYVFRGTGNLPCREEEPTDPLGAYGRTKLAGEQAVERSGCRYLIFRTAWLYSAFGNNFVKTMRRLTAEREQLNVVFDQVGTPTYAGDLAALIFSVVEEGVYERRQGVYHFSNEGVCSWYDFAKEIAALSGRSCDIRPCHSDEFPSKVKRPAFSVLDKSKVKRDFGWKIPYWKDSLVKCIRQLETEVTKL